MTTIILLTIWLITGCNNRKASYPTNITRQSKLNIDFISNKFKFHDLKSFSIDTIGWEERLNIYQKLDSISFDQVYQDTSQHYLGQHKESVDLDFYYSTQKNDRGLIECTFLSQREGEYCDRIFYKIYDLKGKLISSFRVAGSCSDGGYYEKAYGQFINDSTYILLSEDNYKTKDIDHKNIITFSKTFTSIKRNGTIIHNETSMKNTVD